MGDYSFVDVEDALCRQVDPELFFPPSGSSLKPALDVCARCHELNSCQEQTILLDLEESLHPEGQRPFGVQGGLTGNQRWAIAKYLRGDDVADGAESDIGFDNAADSREGTSPVQAA